MNRRFLELAVICAAALLLPSLLGRTLLSKEDFDPAPLKQIKAKAPAYVFIGDSMCRSRIDVEQFESLTGKPVGDLIQNGSGSARWYLFFKNYLAASGARPKMTFIFFRDTVLTDPTHRATGKYRRQVEEAMTDSEPVVERLLSLDAPTTKRGRISSFLAWAYPVQARQTAVRESIQERLLQMAGFSLTRDGLRQRVTDTFDLQNLRKDVASDLASQEVEEISKFDPSPDASFLPHILELSRKHQLPICFVRVKRSEVRDEEWLEPYIRDLRSYIIANGGRFYDESEDPAITKEMFGDGDHIDRKFRPFVTERFRSQVKDLAL